MENREIIYGDEARQALKIGIDKVAKAVAVTIGAKGRTVGISKYHGVPYITKDGVNVAKEIFLKDPAENMGAQLIKAVAAKTADKVGDGTSVSCILSQALVEGGMKSISAGANPMDVKRGIDKATKVAVKFISENAIRVSSDSEDLKNIAAISANNDTELGTVIAESIKAVGNNGVISVESSKSMETYITYLKGMQFDRGYLSPYFITNKDKMSATFSNCAIFLYDGTLSEMKPLIPLLDKVSVDSLPLLIIADSVEGEALTTLTVNNMRGAVKVVAVKAPSFGDKKKDILDDIAILTGAKIFDDNVALKIKDVEMEHLGLAKKITVTKDSTTIIGGAGDVKVIEARVKQLEYLIENGEELERSVIQERLAKITGGVAVIHVGAASEVELKEKRDRVDDALAATKAAVEEGVVAGGGVIYVRALSSLKGLKGANEDENMGINVVRKALEVPLKQIVNNAGCVGEVVLAKVLKGKGGFGYNVKTNKYEDLIKSGVIDPAKVGRVALENSASVTGAVLTTECLIVKSGDDNPISGITNDPMGF
jgi:chaperonin GroEL|tara:strand:+ start:9554 stop:11176 length:1623 start_codon:yes stop_codon:yes gene_type:complete